jgi:hypothetical protein
MQVQKGKAKNLHTFVVSKGLRPLQDLTLD